MCFIIALNALQNNMKITKNSSQIFVSPHLDDAVLSCYPMISDSISKGINVEIWTIMTGIPSKKARFSEFALHLSKPNPVGYAKMRQDEDFSVGKKLGAKVVHFGFQDAIYRNDEHGQPIYQEANDVFNKVDLRELYLVNQIFGKLREYSDPESIIICPSAMCGHVDHILTRLACEMLPNQIVYYNEFPYTINIQSPLQQNIQDEWADKIRMYKSQTELLFKGEALKKLLSQHQPELISLQQKQTLIPHKLHFIWVGDAPIPPAAITNLDSWRNLLGEKWEIRLWTNKDLNESNFGSEVLKKIKEAPYGIQKADILRYQILSKEGGWYFDLDFEPLQSIEPIALLLHREELILCNEDDAMENKTSNGFFACSAGNAAISAMAGEVLKQPLNTGNFDMSDIVTNTGPVFFNSMLQNANAVHLPVSLFYPVTFSGIISPQKINTGQSFAKHKWHNRYSENRILYFGTEESPERVAFSVPFFKRSPQIMIFCFVKDEPELMSRWIPYHAKLVGMKNILIIDHGSKSETKTIFNKFAKSGLKIFDAGMYSFADKAEVLTKVMMKFKHYRLLIPLDADEFICMKNHKGMDCNRQSILKSFRNLPDKPVVFKFGTFDVCNQPEKSYLDPLIEMKEFRFFPPETTEVFSTKAPSKSFFPGKYFVSTDDGNHIGKIEPNEGFFSTNLSLVHFYTRGYDHFISKYKNADEIIGVSNHEEHIQKGGACFHWIERNLAIKRGEARKYFETRICSMRGRKEKAISKALRKNWIQLFSWSKTPMRKIRG